jgi:hypothetical protein
MLWRVGISKKYLYRDRRTENIFLQSLEEVKASEWDILKVSILEGYRKLEVGTVVN